jgi:UDP-GlcNAc:undecaprenyl-phosphate GlcNAc-1-phosphate transferase
VAVAAFAAFATALAVAAAAVPPVARLARRTGIVDRPGPLKLQQRAVPYLGGVAVMAGILAASWTRALVGSAQLTILVPLGLALVLGVADDARDLPVASRVVGELGIGVAVAWAVGTRYGPAAWVAVTLVTVLLVNGVNLLDGLDGLASGVAMASAAGFAVLLSGGARLFALAVLGAFAGFLVYNFPPARIYLGDGGSYLAGTALAIMFVDAWRRGSPGATSIASLALVALPVAEVAWAIVRRWRARLPLMEGDRGHSYDRLMTRGWTAGRAAAGCVAAQAAMSALAVAATVGGVVAAIVAVVVVALVLTAGAAGAGLLAPSEPDGPRR